MPFNSQMLVTVTYLLEFVFRKFQVLLFAVADCFEKLSLDVILKDVWEVVFFVENPSGVVVDETVFVKELD